MKRTGIAALILLANSAVAFDNFKAETARVSAEIACPKPKINQGGGFDALYSCIGGVSETVKVFVNAERGDERVYNLKFLWNDWTKDRGYGVHADAAMAKAWLAALATRYAPLQVEQVVHMFFSNKDATIRNDKYVLAYTYRVGPAIDERMFVITRVPKASATSSR